MSAFANCGQGQREDKPRRVRSYGLSRIRRVAACQLDAASVMDFRPAKVRNLLRDLKPLRPLRENVLGPLASVRSTSDHLSQEATICHEKHCIDQLANA